MSLEGRGAADPCLLALFPGGSGASPGACTPGRGANQAQRDPQHSTSLPGDAGCAAVCAAVQEQMQEVLRKDQSSGAVSEFEEVTSIYSKLFPVV